MSHEVGLALFRQIVSRLSDARLLRADHSTMTRLGLVPWVKQTKPERDANACS